MIVRWTEHDSYLSFSQKSLNWHFLAWPRPSQATQYSLGMESPKRYPNLWIGWLLLVLWQLPCTLLKVIVRAFLATKILRSRIFNVPLPYGMHLKVSHKGRHIFEWLHPQQHRSAVDETRNSQGWSLSIPFLRLWGSGVSSSPFKILRLLCKVVHFWYCLCTWLPCRIKNAGAHTSNKTGCLWTPLLVNQTKGILGWGT